MNLNDVDQVPKLSSKFQCQMNQHQRILVGKLISPTNLSGAALKAALQKLWKIRLDFTIHSRRNNLFIFTFSHEIDTGNVLSNRP